MKKKKLAASLLLAGALAAQAGMPTLAAYTADNNPYGDQHTTFGVKETNETEIKNQISFQIPLYVTMVAVKSKDTQETVTKMAVPTNYIIRNTGNGDTTIGVTKVTAEHLGSDWSVIASPTTPTIDKQMRFTIGGLDVAKKLDEQGGGTFTYTPNALTTKGDKNVLFDATDANKRAKVLEAAENSQFVKKEAAGNKIYPLGENEENKLTLTADTKANDARTANNTVAVFKVVYTVSALGTDGNPITTATPYAGENAADAGYKDGKVTTKIN